MYYSLQLSAELVELKASSIHNQFGISDADGIRTHLHYGTSLKGWRLDLYRPQRHLESLSSQINSLLLTKTDIIEMLVGSTGFEPMLGDPNSPVLPLHQDPI